jgi:beta-hydroxylase
VRQVPTINAAMFALLGPQSRLVTHRDPFAGSLRYHLGLITPNSPDCFIEVDGTPYVWKDGEDFVFDETYIHRAFNRTDTSRVILFCDVDRPLRWPMSWVNRIFVKRIAKASATRNVEGEKIGFLNHGFNYVYRVRILFKRLKKWNQGVYYGLKYAGIAGLLYWIFF